MTFSDNFLKIYEGHSNFPNKIANVHEDCKLIPNNSLYIQPIRKIPIHGQKVIVLQRAAKPQFF